MIMILLNTAGHGCAQLTKSKFSGGEPPCPSSDGGLLPSDGSPGTVSPRASRMMQDSQPPVVVAELPLPGRGVAAQAIAFTSGKNLARAFRSDQCLYLWSCGESNLVHTSRWPAETLLLVARKHVNLCAETWCYPGRTTHMCMSSHISERLMAAALL